LFEDVKPIVQSADAALVNLETAVIESGLKPIKKAGPALRTDARVLDMIREIGFTGVTLANNHFADYGQKGVEESLRLLNEYKLWHVGAGMNAEEAAEIGYLQAGDKKIAVINACEHEFTVATETKAGCNALEPLKMALQITKAKKEADYIIVIIHGGHEHYNLPAPRMQEMYRAFVDFGADAVVNHHQHCYSGYEMYKGRPIVYGLGNFFFDWQGRNADWNDGYMVKLEFGKEMELQLIPYIQNANELGVRLMNETENEKFDKKIAELNAIIADPKQLQEQLCEWAKVQKEEYMRIIRPAKGKRIAQLERMHLITEKNIDAWMPEYLKEDRQLLLKSLFQCESHQEIMNILLQR
jgi:poly-gamma-glutamate synthesis protein (capsule biosynthesis protein)